MKSKDIKRVVCLMDDEELKRFEVDLLATYSTEMTSVERVNMKAAGVHFACPLLSIAYVYNLSSLL